MTWNMKSYSTTVLSERMWHCRGSKHTLTPPGYFQGVENPTQPSGIYALLGHVEGAAQIVLYSMCPDVIISDGDAAAAAAATCARRSKPALPSECRWDLLDDTRQPRWLPRSPHSVREIVTTDERPASRFNQLVLPPRIYNTSLVLSLLPTRRENAMLISRPTTVRVLTIQRHIHP